MRLYRLKNRGVGNWWVFADSVEEAIDISMEPPANALRRENITLVSDQTDFYRNSTDLENVQVKGTACIQGPGHTWVVCRGGKKLRG